MLQIAFTQAALGAEVVLETFDGDQVVTLDPGAQTGDVLRLRGLGMPELRRRRRGDILVQLEVVTPTALDERQAELLNELAELRGEEISPPESGVLGKLRSAFR